MQCGDFLKTRPGMKIVERDDTAGSAREIAEGRLAGTAAICGADAARLYGLEILRRGIETNKHNFTRFLLLADERRAAEFADPAHTDKASLLFTLSHTQGSLSKVLTVLSFYDINLTKNTVAAHHRTRVGIPLLCRRDVRRSGALPAGHRRRTAPHQRLPHPRRIRRMPQPRNLTPRPQTAGKRKDTKKQKKITQS